MKSVRRLVDRLRQEERPIRFLVSRALLYSRVSGLISFQRGGPATGRYRIRFFRSAISANAWVYPERVSEEESLVQRVLRPGDTYVDVGANVGLLALRAASVVGPGGRVIAVEAHPRIARYLAANARLNGFDQIGVEPVAVGDNPGMLTLTDHQSDDQNSLFTNGSGGIPVPVVRLDDLLPATRVPRVHLLKLDVEGFELAALRGAASLLARVDRVLFESSPSLSSKYGYRSSEVHNLLRGAGFTLRELSSGRLLPAGYEPAGFENVFAERDPAAG